MSDRRHFLKSMTLGSGAVMAALHEEAFAIVQEAAGRLAPEDTAEDVAVKEWFWSRVQSAFELDRTLIHLNSGGASASPGSVHRALKRYLDYSNQAPSYYMWKHLEPLREGVRQKLARAFGCDAEELAITRNTSESMETVQFGMDLHKGDEVVVSTQAYERMLLTWDQIQRRRGIVVKRVTIPVPLMDPGDYVERIREAITEKTRAIMVMHVINHTGQITPVGEISRLAHARGIPVICDGAHSFAHFPFTLQDMDCDFYGTSLHKWCCAPVGTGFLYVKRDRIKEIWPLMAAPEDMDDDIRKFESIGTHPAAHPNAIAEALAFNEGIGLDRKAARLRYLNRRWIDRLRPYENIRFRVDIDDPSQWCGIVTVHIDGVNHAKLCSYLLDECGIFVTHVWHKECNGIRVSPNVYTLLSEIDSFADVMEKVAQGEVKEVQG
ncbi:MAG: aminotransferase class V-fold PLP-dependent enzyme [Planctomycetota bacterium]